MHIVQCQHPHTLQSPYTGDMITVPCGKCDCCLNNASLRWINKLDTEAMRHKFTYMVTLTYDDDNVPRLGFSDDMDSLVFINRDADYCIPLHEIMDFDCPYMHDENGEWLDHEVEYLRDRLLHPLGLPCCYNRDLQLFNKRFNKYCFSHVTHTYQNFRFFACFEYGGTTYRSHYHALYYFDDERISQRFEEILSACWTYGDTRGSSVYSNAGRSYVAQYANMHSHLPSFYNHPKLRERTLFSRCPSIGFDSSLDEDLPRIYDELPTRRFKWNVRKKAYANDPVSSSFKSRFFPKVPGYSIFDASVRDRLYGIVEKVPSSTFKEFEGSASLCCWLVERGIANESEKALVTYVDFLKRNKSVVSDGLRRLYRVSLRVNYCARLLHTSTRYIVSRIVEFYKKLDYEKLREFYQFQSDYAKMHDVSDLAHCYPNFVYFVNKVYNNPDLLRPLFVRNALMSFGYNPYSCIASLESTFDYKAVVSVASKIYKDTHKRHHANRYRDGKLMKRDPQLANILRNYQKWQIEI